MTVHLMAERPETLDMMRRHIDLLAQDFLDMGYGATEFAFGQNTPDPQGDSEQPAHHAQNKIAAQDDNTVLPTPLAIQTDRIDIRI